MTLPDADEWRAADVASKLDCLSPLYFGQHRTTKRCDGVPRERAPLRGLRDEALRLYQQRSRVTNIRSDVRFIGTRYVRRLAERGMRLLPHSETIDQAGSFYK